MTPKIVRALGMKPSRILAERGLRYAVVTEFLAKRP
jgi:hypothetical protein